MNDINNDVNNSINNIITANGIEYTTTSDSIINSNTMVENTVGNTIEENNEYQDALITEQEIQDTYNNLDTNQFFILVFVIVLLSMIFETGMKFVKGQIDKLKEEQMDYTKYKKAMIIMLALYTLMLIIFFIISLFVWGFPIEIVIALIIASLFMVLVSTFFKFRMLLPKFKNKK